MKTISKLTCLLFVFSIILTACKKKDGDSTPPMEEDPTAHYESKLTFTYPNFDNPNEQQQDVYTFEYKNDGFSQKA